MGLHEVPDGPRKRPKKLTSVALGCHKVGAISDNESGKWDFTKCKTDLETPEEPKNVALDCHKVGVFSSIGSRKWSSTCLIVTRPAQAPAMDVASGASRSA